MIKISSGLKPDYTKDITNVTFESTNGYSDNIVTYAKYIKAANPGYSDSFYLDYARQDLREESMRQKRAHHAAKLAELGIPDTDWAKYTYEEIISMAGGGIYVPENVLAWAYAMQETDITSYVIVSDDVSAFDTDFRTEATSDSEVNNLQVTTRKYIVMAEKTTTALQNEYEEFQITSNRAQDIKREKENNYQKIIDDINSDFEEFKKLDNKKALGLTSQEEERYKELGNSLKEKSLEISDLKNEEQELKDYVQAEQNLSKHTQEAMDIAQETINKADSLSRFDKSLSITKDYGKISLNTLSLDQTSNESVPEIAYRTATALQDEANIINTALSDTHAGDINSFAESYIAQMNEKIDDFDINNINGQNTNSQQPEDNLTENIFDNTEEQTQQNIKKSDFPQITEAAEASAETPEETPEVPGDEGQQTPPQTQDIVPSREVKRTNTEQTQIGINSQKRGIQATELTAPQDSEKQLDTLQTQVNSQITELRSLTSKKVIDNSARSNSENKEFLEINNNVQEAVNNVKQNVSQAAYQRLAAADTISEVSDKNSEFLPGESTELNIPQANAISETDENNSTAYDTELIAENIRVNGNKAVNDIEIFNIKPVLQNNSTEEDGTDEDYSAETNERYDIPENNNTLNIGYSEQSTPGTMNNTVNLENDKSINSNSDRLYVDGYDKNAGMPENITLNNLSQAASAAVYSNSVKETPNTDKEEKRLTRFNNDSIINSRKKKKKVTAASDIQKGNVNS